jgi:hypothetical protein
MSLDYVQINYAHKIGVAPANGIMEWSNGVSEGTLPVGRNHMQFQLLLDSDLSRSITRV